MHAAGLDRPEIQRLLEARLHDPFSVLGRHPDGPEQVVVRAFAPATEAVEIVENGATLDRLGQTDLFEWRGPARSVPAHYRLRFRRAAGSHEAYDAYSFAPLLDEAELWAFNGGHHVRAYRCLGALCRSVDEIPGVLFAVWAPDAERVSVVGDFNAWDGRCHPMRVRGSTGVWELFIPELDDGVIYKYEIRNRHSGEILLKADPFGREFELRPATATRVRTRSGHQWQDGEWLAQRSRWDWLRAPVSIYEAHLGSWRRHADGSSLSYRELAETLVPYVRDLGFTHLEVLPLTEYPLDESWGYQPVGYFAPTRRYGTADDFRHLVDACHAAGLGLVLDWVPGHFPRDTHGLARFDGSTLFEYPDPRKGAHPDWGTLVFNYDRNEVRSFLLSSATYWLEEFHVDGLRVDAVASMLYLDYSRRAGEWAPNVHGGNANLEAIAFLRQFNETTHREFPGSLTLAEESTAWPGVSRPTTAGGLGFSMKWNMGWMHDTLAYLARDPVHRRYHHDLMTFGPLYAFTENFVLPLSHDEVVHLKGSLLGRMPGDRWQQLANLRLLLLFQWAYPGKKLLFMGGELGQPWEWDHAGQLGWHLLEDPAHGGIQRLVRDLNQLYRETPALHERDFDGSGFAWLRWDDAEHSVLSFVRRGSSDFALVALNFTPVPRPAYRLGVPEPGRYRERLNSDSRFYGGSDLGNALPLEAEPVPCMGQAWSVAVTLPPLAGLIVQRDPG